jgi:Leucine-rich repeat (LRR) protein
MLFNGVPTTNLKLSGKNGQEMSEQAYNGTVLPMTEISVLKALERLLQDTSSLNAGEAIPVMQQDTLDRNESNIGCYAQNSTIVALSVRFCALTSLPPVLGDLTNLQQLDVTGNQLSALPESLGNLSHLKKLYVDENQLLLCLNHWEVYCSLRKYMQMRTA